METPRAHNLCSSLREFTLSKDYNTSEQYTAILRFFANNEIHVSTTCAEASRAPLSGMYAN